MGACSRSHEVHASCDQQQLADHCACSVRQGEATQAFTWDKKQQQQQLALRSGKLKLLMY